MICMHAEVCSVLVTASWVWNVDKYLVALQRLRVVDLIGQDVVGCAGFKRLLPIPNKLLKRNNVQIM